MELNPYKDALDMDYAEPQPYMGQIHKDIRFNHILTKGLTTEERETITKKHTIPDNCTLLDAPILNQEVKAVLTDASKLRDHGIEMSQKQLGLATSIIAKTMTDLITTEEVDKHKLLTDLADATKLLTNIHYHQTQTRIKLISPILDRNFNQTLSKTTRDTFLYGENLPELLRNVKQLQQAAAQLKKPPPTIPLNIRSNNMQRSSQGNRSGPPLKIQQTVRGGPRKTTQQPRQRQQPRWRQRPERVAHQQGRYRNAPTKR